MTGSAEVDADQDGVLGPSRPVQLFGGLDEGTVLCHSTGPVSRRPIHGQCRLATGATEW